MNKRGIESVIFSAFFAAGASAVIGGLALPDVSPYVTPLIVSGALFLLIGLIGLGYLWFTAPDEDNGIMTGKTPKPDKGIHMSGNKAWGNGGAGEREWKGIWNYCLNINPCTQLLKLIVF